MQVLSRAIGSAWLFVAAVGVTSLGCAGDHAACSPVGQQDGSCGEGACVVGQCRAPTASVVAVESRRVVVLARDVAVLSSASDVQKDARVVPFGAAASGDAIVLMSFDADVTKAVTVDGAFLVVEPEAASPGPTSAITIEIAPILAPWKSPAVSWGRTPTLGLAAAEVRIPPSRRTPMRVDVTEIVSKQRGIGHGLALVASGSDPIGARLVTAARSSNGPRLELYLKGP